jgi:octaprenyl-diphosphate synthase
MTQPATIQKSKTPSLDSLYKLIQSDLRQVDGVILSRAKNDIPLIHNIASHIVTSGGKRIRPALTLISSQACGYKGSRQIPLAAAVEFIHTATLLHDDVVDESKVRRGLATANEMFGNKASILVGDFLLSQAFQLMVADGSLKVLKILSDAAAVISKGEVMQLMIEGKPETTIENYLQVISAKTAVLFAAACELGAIIAGTEAYEDPLREFGVYIGIAFQLIDDALDYNADEETLGKKVGDDFREGKITLPVIIAYNNGNDKEKAFWQRTINERVQENGDLEEARFLMNKHDTINQTTAMAKRYCTKATQALVLVEGSLAREAMLEMAAFCASRVY